MPSIFRSSDKLCISILLFIITSKYNSKCSEEAIKNDVDSAEAKCGLSSIEIHASDHCMLYGK